MTKDYFSESGNQSTTGGAKRRFNKLYLWLTPALLVGLIGMLSGCQSASGFGLGSIAPLDQANVSRRTQNPQIAAFLKNLESSDSFFKKNAGAQSDFRGIYELADCSSKGDICMESSSDAVATDNSKEICASFVAWAENLGANQVSGPEDSGWLQFANADPQEKCLQTLNGSLRWMPGGLTSEQILLNGTNTTLGAPFTAILTRTEELGYPDQSLGPQTWPAGKTPKPTYSPKYSYTVQVDTEKFGSNVSMKAQSKSWKHQSAAFLDVVAYMRHHFTTYQATDPVLAQFMIDFFTKRYGYDTKLTAVESADHQVVWFELAPAKSQKICLSVTEPTDTGDGLDVMGAARIGLGGGNMAFEGLGKEVPATQADTAFGNYVLGGCGDVPQVSAHPERLIVVNPTVNMQGFQPAPPTSDSQAKATICQAAKLVKARIDALTQEPLASLTNLTVSQGIQLSNWTDPRVELLTQQVDTYIKLKPANQVKTLNEQNRYVEFTVSYIRQAGGQYANRKNDQQFKFAKKAKNVGEYYNLSFNVPGGVNDVGSFRFEYEPVLKYCGLN